MSLSYTLRESISGFRRTRLAAAISIITVAISLLFLGLFAVATVHTTRFIELLRNRVELEVFLDDPFTNDERATLQKNIESEAGVEKLTYVSKDEAAAIFRREFGENILDILDVNPLPASFRVDLKDGYKTSASVKEISDRIGLMDGIESVRYRKELLELIDTRAASANNLTLGLGVVISLSAILLVSNTIRLAIYAKRHIIRTMELVGATRGFIRIPFLLEGMIQGLLGGVVASFLLYTLLEYALQLVSVELSDAVHLDPFFHAALLLAGCVLGLVGGLLSVFRFMRTATT